MSQTYFSEGKCGFCHEWKNEVMDGLCRECTDHIDNLNKELSDEEFSEEFLSEYDEDYGNYSDDDKYRVEDTVEKYPDNFTPSGNGGSFSY